jgi:pimeloyl-ACP methyl ester carboxylesterase
VYAAGTALLVLIGASIVTNAVAYAGWAWAWRHRDTTCELLDDEAPSPWPARALAWLHVFALECAAGVGVALRLPLELGRERMRGSGRPVVVVTGWVQHRGHVERLARRLRRDGMSVVVASAPGHDVESRAASLAETIGRLRAAHGGEPIDVVACGTGGLVARACVRARGRRSGIRCLITLGTPHQGTRAFPWLRRFGALAELRPASPLLGRLRADDPVPATADCIAIYSLEDAFVIPSDGAYYPGAFNIELRGLGHLSLAVSRRVYELIRENLADAATSSHAAVPGANR